MREAARLFGKVTIILFCLWHMTAVAVYAIPGESQSSIKKFLNEYVNPTVVPYLLITSQWQQWNLFSPDPLRRVMTYEIEIGNGEPDGWILTDNIEPGAFPWWRHAAQFKMLGTLLDGNTESDTQHSLAERYLQLRCQMYGLPDESPIRLTYRYYIIPVQEDSMSVDEWWHYEPEMFGYTGHETRCTSDSPAS